MSQSPENFRTERRTDEQNGGKTDGQILIHRTLPATADGPTMVYIRKII